MLFISILLAVWFVVWLYFAYQKHEMIEVITDLMIYTFGDEVIDEDVEQEEK